MSRLKTVKVTSDSHNFLQVEVKEIEKSLESYYKEIGCDTIDITPTNILGVEMIVDDEGRFVEENLPTVFSNWHTYPMVGTVLFVRIDEENEGTTVSLTDADIEAITKAARGLVTNRKNGEQYPVLII